MKVRLTAVVGGQLDDVGCLRQQWLGVFALGNALLIVRIGNAGVNFDRVGSQSFVTAHVSRQNFQVNLDLLRGGLGMLFGIRGYDRNRVAELEDLLLAENRTVPAVALVGREGDQAGNRVLAFNVLPGNNLDHAGHLFRFRGVDALDVGVRDLGLSQSQAQGAFGHMQGHVGAEIPGAGNLCQSRRTHGVAAHDGLRIV